MDNRIIRVKGRGSISIPPDCIQINMKLENLNKSYEMAMEESNKSLEDIRNTLKEEGFHKKDIKTTRFNVDTRYDGKNDKDGNYKRYFVGYEVLNNLSIEFEQDPKKLGRVLNLLAHCKAKPEFTIRYKLKDYREMKNKLLENAIHNAREKALIIANAAGVKLGEIINIDYSWEEMEVYHENINYSIEPRIMLKDSIMDLQPEDLKDSDTVTVVWEINR